MRIMNMHCPGWSSNCDACPAFVLVQDERGLYTVYVGIVHRAEIMNDQGRAAVAQWVADQGTKMPYAVARMNFLGLKEKDYHG